MLKNRINQHQKLTGIYRSLFLFFGYPFWLAIFSFPFKFKALLDIYQGVFFPQVSPFFLVHSSSFHIRQVTASYIPLFLFHFFSPIIVRRLYFSVNNGSTPCLFVTNSPSSWHYVQIARSKYCLRINCPSNNEQRKKNGYENNLVCFHQLKQISWVVMFLYVKILDLF